MEIGNGVLFGQMTLGEYCHSSPSECSDPGIHKKAHCPNELHEKHVVAVRLSILPVQKYAQNNPETETPSRDAGRRTWLTYRSSFTEGTRIRRSALLAKLAWAMSEEDREVWSRPLGFALEQKTKSVRSCRECRIRHTETQKACPPRIENENDPNKNGTHPIFTLPQRTLTSKSSCAAFSKF